MYDTVVLATDGSASTERAVAVGMDLVDRFDGAVHALYVVDESEIDAIPTEVQADLRSSLEDSGREALEGIAERSDREVTTAIREGQPAAEICDYAEAVDADVVVTGTRGRHGEHALLLGSVAEAVVRKSPAPVLTVRQLEGTGESPPGHRGEA